MTNASRRPSREVKLELLPVMNLVTILIPMLLMAAQLAELAAIDATVPAISEDAKPPQTPQDEPLVLQITGSGVRLAGVPADVDIEQDLRCTGDVCVNTSDYPLAALTDQLVTMKAAHPDDSAITIEAAGEVPYGVVVAVMDAARATADAEPLYPHVQVSAGEPE